MIKNPYIERPPRIQPELPEGEFDIPGVPEVEKEPAQLLVQVFLPLISILGYLLLSIFGQGRNLFFMLPMALSVIVTVGLALYSRQQQNKKRQELQSAYKNRLIEIRKDMQVQHDIQRRFYQHTYPDPEKLLQIAYEAHQRGLNPEKKLLLNKTYIDF